MLVKVTLEMKVKSCVDSYILILNLTYAPTPQNCQTHLNNLLAVADKLFECIRLFCGVGTKRFKFHTGKNFSLDFFSYWFGFPQRH